MMMRGLRILPASALGRPCQTKAKRPRGRNVRQCQPMNGRKIVPDQIFAQYK